MHSSHERRPWAAPLFLCLCFAFLCAPPAGGAQDPQKALDEAVRELEPSAPQQTSPSRREDLFRRDLGGATLRLMDVSLDVLAAAGFSTEEGEDLQGGGHDPRRRGFTLQQAELSFLGAVDPYFLAETHVILTEDDIELEEAFARTLALPYGLQLEAGYFFTEFGRINPLHPHAWIWLDQPVAVTRLFGGEGMRGTGVRVGALLPLPWHSEAHFGVQNAGGELMTSFFSGKIENHGDEGEEEDGGIGGRPIVDEEVRNLGDLVYLARWVNSFFLSDTWTAQVGFSGLYGPNFTGPDGETRIYGGDVLLKWVAERNFRGRPFLRLEGEILKRDLEADEFVDEADAETVAGDTLRDWGFYLQGLYGFSGRWAAGLRWEYASGSGESLTEGGRGEDPFRSDRTRISPLLVYSPSEFSRLRLQYNYDDADHLDDIAHTLWLGVEVLIGAHPAHTY